MVFDRHKSRLGVRYTHPPETVEDLGMGYVDDAAELRRLCGQFDSCIVLSSAQHLVPTVASGVMT